MTMDISDLVKLEQDLGRIPGKAVARQTAVVKLSTERLQRRWRANARKTAGAHGRRYPSSITHEINVRPGRVEGIVGPDASKPQGGMSFELGSSRQPPHHDGLNASRVEEKRFSKEITKSLGELL